MLPEDNVDVIRTRLYAANALALLGQTADAIEVVEPVVGELEEVIGPDHQYTLEARQLLATYYLWQGDVDEARRRADGIRADAVATFGEGAPAVESIDALIGAVAAKSGG